ncbi:bile acid:Na+ symporter, BASS family [Paracoccus isoporae]|uniref:Bile acid:Na+ symporter, BASS family n=1 Tax=Paracoccus isoporae TaxID=591205 RepID=A0A1G6U5Y7_9RHOB|nr:hypothetical protein [Paracoccus isoporae]SDD35945.1 bile acid:Na+ symporter, BASS family [Paracoccus isoporae]
MSARDGLIWVGRHARPILLAGLFIVPLLPMPHGMFQPVLPLLVSMLIGLALCRLDLPALLADLADPRFLPSLLIGLALFQIVAAMLFHGLGSVLGVGPGLLMIVMAFAAAPTLTSAPNIALMLGYDARLTLLWTLCSTFLAPATIPLAFGATGLALEITPSWLALKLFAMLMGGIGLGVVLRRGLGPARIARDAAALDGMSALVVLAFLFPLLDGAVSEIAAQPDRAMGLAVLAVALNLGANLVTRWLAGFAFARPRARALGLIFGNRNIAILLAALPHDPSFSLFVAMAQIPIYSSPVILRALDGEGAA